MNAKGIRLSQSLYRKYRSRGFDEIVGQSHVTDLLKNAIKKGTFAHAYLLTGPRGTGKTSVARILAHAVNNLPYTDDSTHLDIIEIDAASNRRIDDIRDLREKVHIAPSSADYKVYIIDEVHMLTGESFNALLKTLEEPPAHAVFILATTELHKVPATIVSRTQRFHFRPGTVRHIVDHLQSIAKKENILIDEDALALIARHSEGGFRDSVSLLDQVSSLSDTAISREDVESLLGLAPSHTIEEIVSSAVAGKRDVAVKQLLSLLDEGIHPMSICSQVLSAANDQAPLHPELYGMIQELIDLPRSHAPHLKLIATIALFASSHAVETKSTHKSSTRTVPAPVAKAPVVASDHKVVKSVPVVEQEKVPVAEKVVAATTSTDEIYNQSDIIDNFEWPPILIKLKGSAPALYAVVKSMPATYEDSVLTLRSGFALHRNKIQSEKYMKQLVDCIKSTYNGCPQIVVAPLEKRVLDKTESAIVDIMGGGEVV